MINIKNDTQVVALQISSTDALMENAVEVATVLVECTVTTHGGARPCISYLEDTLLDPECNGCLSHTKALGAVRHEQRT